MVLWLWFTRYIGGRPKFDLETMPYSERNQKIEMIKSDTSGSLIFFFGYPFFYYDFWKLVKKSLLVDLLTFVAI